MPQFWSEDEEAIVMYFSSRDVKAKSIAEILALKLDTIRNAVRIQMRMREMRAELVGMGHPQMG